MPMFETQALLREIDGFLDESGMSATTFGRLAVNDGKLVGRLRSGRGVTLRVAAKITAFIAQRQSDAASGSVSSPVEDASL